MSLVILGLSEIILPLVYGKEFSQSVLSLRILLVGAVFHSVTKVFSVFIVTQGKMLYNVWAVVGGVIVTLVLDVLLVPAYGIEGASIATSISYFVIFLILFLVLIYKFKITRLNYFLLEPKDIKYILNKMYKW